LIGHGLHVHLYVTEFWRTVLRTIGWLLALVWVLRTYDAIHLLPTVPDLTFPDWDAKPEGSPTLTVVVPARDEAEKIAATLDALMQADYAGLRVLVVDDRSTDGTGAIVDAYVAEYATRRPGALSAIHITELPDGWLGKTFALMVATENSASDYVLFTDADVLFSPSILRRALVCAQEMEADHLVVLPTVEVRSRGEGIVLGFLQAMSLWAVRPWMVQEPKARRDVAGIGAFNFVRREALNEIGGWMPQRLAVLEDLTLGRRMRAAGMRQRMVFAPGMVLVHWAKGGHGLLVNMTKNLFSAFGFQPVFVVLMTAWIGVFFLLPLAGLVWWGTVVQSLVILCCIGALYRVMGAASRIDARYAWLYPLGATGMMFAMVRSMVVVLAQRGVTWRGTTYPLRDLRAQNSPFVWEREAGKRRDEGVRASRVARKMASRGKKSR
jgi:glycosyltransferase involved in cell wall biosynthesis